MEKSNYARRDRLIQDGRNDSYQEREKWPEPTVCSECGAVFSEGRWSWWEADASAHAVVCPACQRIKDSLPAGLVDIQGRFFDAHRDEITHLIHNLEDREKEAHPMERIMTIRPDGDHLVVTTTGIHLARRIGEALKHAYQGNLDFSYGVAEKSIRVSWLRQ